MSMTPYTFDLEPGQTKHQTFGEANFIFVDFADRELEVSINGSWQTLRKGTVFKSRTGMFDQFEIRNPDPASPCRVVMFIGTDEVTNQIVEGEISIEPILRSANGTTKPDTRSPLQINLEPINLVIDAYTRGDLIESWTLASEPSPYTRERRLFQGPAGTVGIHINADSGDFTTIQLYDQKTLELVDRFVIEATPAGFVQDVVYVNGAYYYIDNGDYIRRASDNAIVVNLAALTGAFGFDGMGYDPINQRFVVLDTQNSTVYTVSALDFNLVESWPLDLAKHSNPAADCPRVDAWTGQYYIANNAALYVYSPDGQYLETLNYDALVGSINFEYGYVPFRDWLFCDNNTIDGTTRYKRALRTYETQPEFQAVRPGCGLQDAMVVPDALPQVTAGISIQKLGNGILVDGEVIKAALEYYYKRQAPDDYLDHVYQFDTSIGGDGLPFRMINTGNRTFARSGVADDFQIQLPGQISLVVDNELTMGAPL